MTDSNKLTFNNIIQISEIRKNIKNIPKVGGVYKHFVDKEGLKYLDGVCPTTKDRSLNGIDVYLVYIGKAKNLFERYEWHLGIRNTSKKQLLDKWLSTLRHSYMANHKNISCLSEQAILNEFMDRHTYSQYVATEDFDSVEEQLIKENDLPLNVKNNSHVFVHTNRKRRNAIYDKYLKEFGNINDSKNVSKTINRKKNINDDKLREYAKDAEKHGIKNKSNFVNWFRTVEKQSASYSRLSKAWDEHHNI